MIDVEEITYESFEVPQRSHTGTGVGSHSHCLMTQNFYLPIIVGTLGLKNTYPGLVRQLEIIDLNTCTHRRDRQEEHTRLL